MNLNNPNILKQHNFAAKTTSLFSYLVKAILLCAAPVMLVGFVLLTEFVIHHERVQDQGDYLIAKEISDSIDAEIMSHIKGLELLAASSTLNDPVRLNDFYNEMQAFHAAYDSHLILADPSRQMLLNTRAKYGATLPKLPTPTDKAGRGGFVIAQATGKPGIGDIVFGPVAKEPLINIAVPVKRDGESRFFLLNTFGASRFERMVSGISLPEGYSFVLVDGAGLELALNPSEKSDALKGSTIVVKSDLTSWSVSLSTPGSPHYRQAAVLLVVVLAVALGATLVGASIVAGKIANSVRSLSSAGIKPSSGRAFTEVESARANLLESDRVQKQALDSLRASEETLRRRNESFSFAQEAAKSGAYEWDVVTNKTVWSDQLWPILGLEKNSCESNYDNWLLSIHPDDRDKANLEVGEALQEKKEINTQWRLMDPQGQIRWVVSRAKPILNDRGEVLRYVGIVIDITDQKLVEESLNDSRERLHMALDAAQAGMWEWNLIDNSVYWSEELWSLYGLEPHSCEQSYENWFGTIHPDDRERVRNQILEAVNNGGELNTEWRVNEPSGGFRYLMSRGKLCTDGQGQSRVYRGVVVDITERKLMQDELIRHRDNLEKLVEIRTEEARESQRLLQTIIDFLPMEVTYLDADGKYVFTNRTFQTWWGKTPQEICGKTPEEVHGEQANFVLKEIADARTGHEQSQQLVYSHPDGTTRHLWTKVTLENRHDGTLKGIVRIAIDVTEIKKAQEALQESEALFRSLFENMPDGIVLISPDGTLDKVNPAAGSILGMSEDEIRLLGRDRILDVVDPRFVSARERLLLTGKVSTELNCRRNDGTIFPIDVTTSFVPDSGGSGKTIISFRDVTDRKLAEKALLESEARLRAYFEAPLLGVASVAGCRLRYTRNAFYRCERFLL